MPTDIQFQKAIDYALNVEGVIISGRISHNGLVDNIRKYFNDNNIECEPMNFKTVEHYIPVDYKY